MSDTSTLSAAVIGLGRMGRCHVSAYQSMGIRLAAVADMNQDAFGPFLDDSTVRYTDWRDLLRKEHIGILSVVTNGPSHEEIVVAAAATGIPTIFCEKPMTTSAESGDRMLAACTKSNSRLYINMTKRVFPAFRHLLAELQSGIIGSVRNVTVVIGGGRGLGCVGTHYVDLMRLIIGSDPVRVRGHIDATGTPNVRGSQFSDPGGYAMFEFRNGARAFLEMSEDIYVPPLIYIHGSLGYIVIDESASRWGVYRFIPEDCKDDRPNVGAKLRDMQWQEMERTSLFEGTVQALTDIIGKPDAKMANGTDGLLALEMILGIHASHAAGGGIVTFPLEHRALDVQMT